ncbi:MAG: SRPBCC family protein [Cryomorphaceae bacterium]
MITVEISVNAPLNTVWECWTRPEHITQWNFASDEWCCPSASNDLRPGGSFNWRMEAKDGSVGFDFTGTYELVEVGRSIVSQLGDGRHVQIHFHEESDGVRLTESFETEGSHTDEQQRQGWQAILGNFKAYVETRV